MYEGPEVTVIMQRRLWFPGSWTDSRNMGNNGLDWIPLLPCHASGGQLHLSPLAGAAIRRGPVCG